MVTEKFEFQHTLIIHNKISVLARIVSVKEVMALILFYLDSILSLISEFMMVQFISTLFSMGFFQMPTVSNFCHLS